MSMRKYGINSDISAEDFFKLQVLEYFFVLGDIPGMTPQVLAAQYVAAARLGMKNHMPCNAAILLLAAKALLAAQAYAQKNPDCSVQEAVRDVLGEVGHLPGGEMLTKKFSKLPVFEASLAMKDIETGNQGLTELFGFATGKKDN